MNSLRLPAMGLLLFILAVPAGFSFAVRQTAPAAAPHAVRYEQSRTAMGSEFTIVAYGPDESRLETAVTAAFEEIFRLDREWSDYIPESDLSWVNRHAADEPVKVDPELFQMLETCFRFSRETSGAFDITVGPLLDVWGFFKGTGRLPKTEELEPAMEHVGWQKVQLDARSQTVSFGVKGMRLDLGGIGKGYAVDRAANVLREAGIDSALLLSGTSSILALGTPPGEQGWSVNLRDPKDGKKSVAQVSLKDESLSTSGNYEKFFRAEGKIYSHIFDPRSGYPAQGVLSTAVIAPSGTQTDALSTAFFVLGKEGTAKYLKSHPGIRVLICTESGCEWLTSDKAHR